MQKQLVVLGGGESGVGTAVLAKKKNFKVFVSDFGKIKKENKNVLSNLEIEWEEGGHSFEKIRHADLAVKSPGIPKEAPVVRFLENQNIRIISEMEFAFRYTAATLIGITGTNGKTTTASLTYEILKNSGLQVALGGNIGTSFAGLVAAGEHRFYVLELSSFQLDDIETFRPHLAVMTNLSPDHLDRYHNSYEAYIESKFRIVMNQTESDYFIYDADDEAIAGWLEQNKIRSQKIPFSVKRDLKSGASLINNEIILTIENKEIIMPVAKLGIQGEHNVKNAMAAATVASLLRIRKQTIRESLEGFQGVEHRLENVLKLRNVQYINDSKATNVNATYYALESMTGPTIWIAGGVDKGNNYEELMPLVNEKVKAIICLGLDNSRLIEAFGNIVDMLVEADSMAEAVYAASRLAEPGNTVLLSPACASFDLFENYEDRGRQFKEAVRKLS